MNFCDLSGYKNLKEYTSTLSSNSKRLIFRVDKIIKNKAIASRLSKEYLIRTVETSIFNLLEQSKIF